MSVLCLSLSVIKGSLDQVVGQILNQDMQSFTHRPFIPGLRLWIISFYTCFSVNAGGSTYYVSKSGKDSGPGSSVQPWHTLARASETLKTGDTLFILPGVYNETLWPVCSGKEGAPVCYFRYGQGEVILSPDSVGQGYGIFTIRGKGMPGYRGDISYIGKPFFLTKGIAASAQSMALGKRYLVSSELPRVRYLGLDIAYQRQFVGKGGSCPGYG